MSPMGSSGGRSRDARVAPAAARRHTDRERSYVDPVRDDRDSTEGLDLPSKTEAIWLWMLAVVAVSVWVIGCAFVGVWLATLFGVL